MAHRYSSRLQSETRRFKIGGIWLRSSIMRYVRGNDHRCKHNCSRLAYSRCCRLSTLGDASTTRGDYYFGNDYSGRYKLSSISMYIPHPLHSSNMLSTSSELGSSLLNLHTVLQRGLRTNDSIARKPTFSFDSLRDLAAYSETTVPLAFVVSNQMANA